jgi:hypothetical protein
MVTLDLRERADTIRERERRCEVGEPEDSPEAADPVVLFYRPVRHFGAERVDLRVGEPGSVPAARDAALANERRHGPDSRPGAAALSTGATEGGIGGGFRDSRRTYERRFRKARASFGTKAGRSSRASYGSSRASFSRAHVSRNARGDTSPKEV